MTSQATREKDLESTLSTLRTKVVSPGAQSKIRSQVLSFSELDALQSQLPETGDENIPDDCSDPDELKFRRANGISGRILPKAASRNNRIDQCYGAMVVL